MTATPVNDVFISYAREDEEFARLLATELQALGRSVWWDRVIPVGVSWDEVIGRQIAEARCVFVVWSPSSVTSKWVRAEAHAADQRGVMVPLTIENVAPPFPFNLVQALDFTDWTGDADDERFVQLVAAVERFVSAAPAAPTETASSEGHSSAVRRTGRWRIQRRLQGAAILTAIILTTGIGSWVVGNRRPSPSRPSDVKATEANLGSIPKVTPPPSSNESSTTTPGPAAAPPAATPAAVESGAGEPAPARSSLPGSTAKPPASNRPSGRTAGRAPTTGAAVNTSRATTAPARGAPPNPAGDSTIAAAGPPTDTPSPSARSIESAPVAHAEGAATSRPNERQLTTGERISGVLGQYVEARNRRSLDALRRVYPALPDALAHTYSDTGIKSEKVQLTDCKEPSLQGRIATVKCRESIEIGFASRRPESRATDATFSVNVESWTIERIKR